MENQRPGEEAAAFRVSQNDADLKVTLGELHRPTVNEAGVVFFGVFADAAGDIPSVFGED